MNARTFRLAGLAVLLGLAACTSCDSEEKSRDMPDDTTIVRGRYVFGHEVRALRPCGEDEALWVVDRTRLLRQLHGELIPESVSYGEVFVVAAGRIGPPPRDGFGAEYAGALTVEDVIYVALEGFGCDFDWSRFRYRAQGNEPFWTLEVLATAMRLTRPGYPDLTWTDVSEQRTEDAVIFNGADGKRHPVKLVIEASPSRDTMSGAYYGLSARLVMDEETLTGHALQGTGTESR